jgi:hypothetical protein
VFLNLKLIAYEIAELLSENHELDVDSSDVLKGLVRFLETAAPGCVVDAVGAVQALAQGADVPVTVVIDEVPLLDEGKLAFWGDLREDLKDPALREEYLKAQALVGPVTFEPEPSSTQKAAPEAFGKDRP